MVQHSRSGSSFEQMASYCRAIRSGSQILVSGTASLDSVGHCAPAGDSAGQVEGAFAAAFEAAAELGGTIQDTVRTRMFLHPDADWRGAAEAHGRIFRGIDPANTTLFVGDLIPPECLVEVELDLIVAGSEE